MLLTRSVGRSEVHSAELREAFSVARNEADSVASTSVAVADALPAANVQLQFHVPATPAHLHACHAQRHQCHAQRHQ